MSITTAPASTRSSRSATHRPSPQPQRGRPTPSGSAERGSDRSALVFQTLLGLAACLALLGVVHQAQHRNDAVGVDDPPPAVFVQTD